MRSKIPDSKSRAQPNARAVNMSRTTVESALVMHAAPSYKEYRKIAEIANIPLSLSEEQYEYAISKRKKASHRFAWAFAVAREMYMVSQPDYLEYGHIEVLGEELIAAHKAVYGESMHHREYEKVACRRSETFQKAYEKSRRSYAVLVAWKIEKPITEFETTRCPVTSNVNYREIDVIDLTVSPTHERISIPGQHTIPAVSQIRAEQTPTTEPLRQPNQCSTINKQSTAGKPSTVKKQSTGKQPIVNKQPVVNGLSTVKYRQQLKEICRQYSRPWTSGNTSNALPSETSSQSVGDDLPSLSEMREQSTSTTRSPRTSAGRNKARVISNLIKEINRPETPYTPQTLIKCTDPNTPRSAIGKTLPGVHPAPHGLVSPPKVRNMLLSLFPREILRRLEPLGLSISDMRSAIPTHGSIG